MRVRWEGGGGEEDGGGGADDRDDRSVRCTLKRCRSCVVKAAWGVSDAVLEA